MSLKGKTISMMLGMLLTVSVAFCQGGFSGIPQNGYNMANANDGYYDPQICHCPGSNQINQNLNQNALGMSGAGWVFGPGGFVYLPQNGFNIVNANGGNSQFNQNLNQNALGMSGSGFGSGGLVYLPQNGINIANANGFNNNINQDLNQNAFGF